MLPLNADQRSAVLLSYGFHGIVRSLQHGDLTESSKAVVDALAKIELEVDAAVEGARAGGLHNIDLLRDPALAAIARTRLDQLGPHPGVGIDSAANLTGGF